MCQRGRSCPPLGHHHLPLPSHLPPFCLLRFICHFFYCFNMLIAFTALLLLPFLFCCCYCLCFFLSSPTFGISFLSFLKLFWVRLVYPLPPSVFVGLILRIWPKDFAHYHLLLPLSHHRSFSLSLCLFFTILCNVFQCEVEIFLVRLCDSEESV